MSKQVEINDKMRAILVDWLIEVHSKFKLQKETLFITINIIDRYLASMICSKAQLQLVGVTALLIACKYEEIYPPELKDFVFITDRAYTKEDVLQMEQLILWALAFDLNFPTSYRFLERYMRMLGEDPNVMTLSLFLMELAHVDIRMIQYPTSVIAAASLCQAYKSITRRLHPDTPDMEKRIENYIRDSLGFNKDIAKVEMFLLCSKELQFLQVRSLNSSLQAVRKKYQGPEFAAVHQFIFQ